MKTLRLLLISLLVMGLTNCKSQNKQDTENKKYPIEITENIKKIKDEGWGYRFYLKEPQVIKTYPIKKGILIAKKGTKMMFFLAEDHIINGDTIPADSKLRMFSVGKPFAYDLSKPTLIQGYPVGTEKIYGNGSNVEFFEEDGEIKWFMPATDIEIGSIPCLANNSIKFYPTGDLHICTLLKDFEYEEKTYLENTTVIFNENGIINPISEYDFGDSHIPWRFKFYDDGNPKEIMLIADQVINGFPCKKNFSIFLYPNGSLKECVISKNIEIEDVVYKKGDKLMFDEIGNIKTNK
ncbi:MAG: hypothetical protein K8R54_09035 [Bacteroidales bacterium]|nr:hypothetical protein [Bacteroidales bacterium]